MMYQSSLLSLIEALVIVSKTNSLCTVSTLKSNLKHDDQSMPSSPFAQLVRYIYLYDSVSVHCTAVAA